MARKTKQQALETRQHITDVALRLFSRHRRIRQPRWRRLRERCWRDARRNLLAFKNKSDLFSGSGVSESNIGDLRLSIRQIPHDDPLSVLREFLVHILEATVTEERRRLLMEIIFHKCGLSGEMVVVQQAQRSLCLESYDRIEQTFKTLY